MARIKDARVRDEERSDIRDLEFLARSNPGTAGGEMNLHRMGGLIAGKCSGSALPRAAPPAGEHRTGTV
jgi:hypothetical protein